MKDIQSYISRALRENDIARKIICCRHGALEFDISIKATNLWKVSHQISNIIFALGTKSKLLLTLT